jgi:hypothetical protein
MKRVSLLLALLTSLVLAWVIPAASAASPPTTSVWHRLNPDQSNPAPEHERLQCIETSVWVCRYDKVPERAGAELLMELDHRPLRGSRHLRQLDLPDLV